MATAVLLMLCGSCTTQPGPPRTPTVPGAGAAKTRRDLKKRPSPKSRIFAPLKLPPVVRKSRRARPLEVRHVHKIITDPYPRLAFPSPRVLLSGRRYVVRAASAAPARLVLGVFRPGASRTEGITYLPREHWVVDLASGRVIIKHGRLRPLVVAAGHLQHMGPKGEITGVLSLADGALLEPDVKLPGKVAIKRGPAIWMDARSSRIWVLATGANGRTYYGPWDPSPAPLELARWLPFYPSRMEYDGGSRTLQVWDTGHTGACVYFRLHPGGKPTCLLEDTAKEYSAKALATEGWVWLQGRWMLHAPLGEQTYMRMTTLGHERLALDLATRKAWAMTPGTCRLTSHMADRMLRSPPTALLRCGGDKDTTYYVWSPGDLRRWRPPQSWLSNKFLTRIFAPSERPSDSSLVPLEGHPNRALGWIDLRRRRVTLMEGLRSIEPGDAGHQLAVRALAPDKKELVLVDRGTLEPQVIATFSDCPRGRLTLWTHHKDMVSINCDVRQGTGYTFDNRWTELFDLERKVRWRVAGHVERILPGRRVVLSDRGRHGAEAWYPASRISVVDLSGPIPAQKRLPCDRSRACARWGRCWAGASGCVARSHGDCKRSSEACPRWGECAARKGRCVAASDAHCQRSGGCKQAGYCAARQGLCVATSDVHCQRSLGCKEAGRCALIDRRCQATTNAHCVGSAVCKKSGHCQATGDGRCHNHCLGTKECTYWGKCTASGNMCVATSHGDCRKSEQCNRYGRCSAGKGRCEVGSGEDCRQSITACKEQGQCSMSDPDRCRATSHAGCKRSLDCKREGKCAASGGECKAASSAHCRRSVACKSKGRCRALKGRCEATSHRDCRRSESCKKNGECTASRGSCRVVSDADCKGAAVCKKQGKCWADRGECGIPAKCKDMTLCPRWGWCTDRAGDKCVPSGNDCRGAEISCKHMGLCTARGDSCVATTDALCRASERCVVAGECAVKDGQCVVPSESACKGAWVCKTMGWCRLVRGRCSATQKTARE